MSLKHPSVAGVALAVAPRRYRPRVNLPTFAVIQHAAELEELRALMEGNFAEPEGPALLARPAWQRQAACRSAGVDAFFRTPGGSSAEAGAMCARCPVRAECLEYALEDPSIVGVWGGTSVNERTAMRRPRRLGRSA